MTPKSGPRCLLVVFITAFLLTVTLHLTFGSVAAAGQTSLGPPVQFTFYTSRAATCPQIPLFSALKKGSLDNCCSLNIQFWKNQDDLRGVLLAGRGDLWLGSLETFARVARLGAPVTVLVVSGWRKYYLISRDPEVLGIDSFAGKELRYAPVAAPVAALLKGLEAQGGPQIDLLGLEPQQLGLMLLQGRIDSAILPEPLVTVLLEKDSRLRVVIGVAELAGKLTGGPDRIPWAGLAVHRDVIRDHPEQIEKLVEILVAEGRSLGLDPEKGITALPDEFETAVGRDLIRRSLKRDLILVERASAVQDEVLNHLKLVAPDLFDQAGPSFPPATFFYRRP